MKNKLKRKYRKSKQKLAPISGMSGAPSKTFTPMELEAALLGSYDLMTRGLLQSEYIVAGEAARCIKENKPLIGDGIDFIITKKHITPSVVSMLKEWATPEVTDKGFSFLFNGVPLRFRFIEKDYEYFRFADIKVYGAEQYKIPNQFENYWEHREEIV